MKTGVNELKRGQLENYLDVAREHGFDALLTISNELPAALGMHPTEVDGRKLRSVKLHHISWAEVLSHAVLQKEFRGVADPEQAWILGELIRYLEHPKSGALEFNDMGPNWVAVRDAVTARTLRKSDKGAAHSALDLHNDTVIVFGENDRVIVDCRFGGKAKSRRVIDLDDVAA